MKRRTHISSFIPCILFAALSVGGCDPRGLGLSNPDFLVIAHRGAPDVAAENTITSLQIALVLGANAIETDICITKDGVLVLWHDRDPDSAVALARQVGAEGLLYFPHVPPVGSPARRPVDELTLDRFLNNYGYNDVKGRRDPTSPIALFKAPPDWTGSEPEFLDWARDEPELKAVYLDVKFASGQVDHARTLVEVLWEDYQEDDSLQHVQFFLLSIHRKIVDAMEAERARLGAEPFRVVWDFEVPGALQGTLDAGLRDVSTGLTPSQTWSGFKREIADLVDARENGKIDSVTVWTFDSEMKLAELLYYSVDGIMTNEPALLHRMWQDTLD